MEFATNSPKFLVVAAGPCRVSADEGNGYKKISAVNGNGQEGGKDFYYYSVQFNSEKERNIKLELTDELYVIYVQNNKIVKNINDSSITRNVGPKVAFIGNSWSVSDGKEIPAAAIGGVYKSYPYIVSDILGLETFAMGGQRTGYFTSSNGFMTNYESMMYALNNYDPDILVLTRFII